MKKFMLNFGLFALIIDCLAIVGGLVVAYYIRANGGDYLFYWPFHEYMRLVLSFLPLWILLFATQGLYRLRNLPLGFDALGKVITGLLSSWGVLIIFLYLLRTPEAQAFPRLVILYGVLLTFIFITSGRLLLSIYRKLSLGKGRNNIRTVLITKNNTEFIKQLERKENEREVVAVIENDPIAKLNEIRKKHRIDEILLSDTNYDDNTILQILDWAETHYITFGLVPGLLTLRSSRVETATIGRQPIMFFTRTPLEGWGKIFKRLMDVLIVVPTLIILSPVFLIIYLVVILNSKGGAIFKQERIGQDGNAFYVHKFRSMYIDSNKKFGLDWSTDEKKDPRITPVGRFLRSSNLDELPQLWDVLMGIMSLVGPRPEQPKYVKQFSCEIPDYLRRHNVKSGLTGWAQINGLRGDTSISERVKYDIYYIENWSLIFDIRIILGTFTYLLKKMSA